MKRHPSYYSVILFLFLLLSCGQKHSSFDFGGIEAILPQHPDRALNSLDSIRFKLNTFSEEERAHYYLLLTEAEDKCFKKHTTDSLINISLNYYQQQDDALHYAKALYLKGRIMEDWNDSEQAVTCFVKALDVGRNTKDYLLLYRIASRTGTIYAHMRLIDQAMNKYQEALRYAMEANDSSYMAKSYSYLGRIYSLKKEWGRTTEMYEKAISIATESGQEEDLMGILNEYMGVCTDLRRYETCDSIINDLQKNISLFRNPGAFYLATGDYYRHLNDTAKAIPFLQNALLSYNKYTRLGACQSLYYLYKKNRRYEQALYFIDLSNDLNDSIKKIENIGKVSTIESNYNREKAQTQVVQQRYQKWRLACFSLVIVVALLFIIGWITYRHKRRIREVEQQIQELEKQHCDLRRQLSENRLIMDENREEGAVLSSKIAALESEKQMLTAQMKQWEQQQGNDDEMKKLSAQMEEKETALNKLKENCINLSDRNRQLNDSTAKLKTNGQILKKGLEALWKAQMGTQTVSTELLDRMRNGTKHDALSEGEWKTLFLIVNTQYEYYEKRLRIYYDKLSKDDIELCCLLRLGFTKDQDIADFLSIQKFSAKKRKQRLKAKLGIEKETLNSDDLERYICSLL